MGHGRGHLYEIVYLWTIEVFSWFQDGILVPCAKTYFRMCEVQWYTMAVSYFYKFLFCKNRDIHFSSRSSLQSWPQELSGKEVGSFEGHPFLMPFPLPRCSVFSDRPWASPNPWADRACVSLGLVCLSRVRRLLNHSVEFSSPVTLQALGSTKSSVRWIPFILCIHGSRV